MKFFRDMRVVGFMAASIFCIAFGRSNSRADTLSLQQAVELGLSLHPSVRAARGELQAASGNFWERISPASPRFRIENEEVPRQGSLSDYGRQKVSVSQGIDFPMLTYYRGRSARQTVRAARAGYEVSLAEAKSEITMAYIDAWLFQKLAAVADTLASAAASLADAGEKKYAAGATTSIERDRFRAQAEQFARRRETAKLDFSLKLIELGQLTGQKEDPYFDLADPGEVDTVLPNPAKISGASAQVQKSQFALKAAKAERSAAFYSFLPQIELELFRQEDRQERLWGGAVELSFPLWFGLSGRGKIQQAYGAVQQATAEAEQAWRHWQIGWFRATRSFENTKRRLQSLGEIGLPAARRAYHASLRAYEVGRLGVTDLLATFLETQAAEREYLEVTRELWHWRTRVEVLLAGQAGATK